MWALWDHRLAHITELKLTGLCHWAVCLSHITAGWMLARCSFLMPLLALHTNNFLAVTDVSSWYSVWENCTILDICLLRFVRFWAVFFVRCVQVMFTKEKEKKQALFRGLFCYRHTELSLVRVILNVYLFWLNIINAARYIFLLKLP